MSQSQQNFKLACANWCLYLQNISITISCFALAADEETFAHRYPARAGIYKSRRRIVRSGRRKNVSFEEVTDGLTEKEFRSLFRMDREQFYELLEIMRKDLTKSIHMGKVGGNETALPPARLAITLRMLAGARYGDLMMLFGICKETVYDIFHDTVRALSKRLPLPLLPNDDRGLRRLADGMKLSRSKGDPLTGCIGALDGICIKIEKPRSDLNPSLFYCRKGYYAIPVQALVDHSYRFLCASANCAGSTHDSLAHSSSKLGMYLMKGLLGKPYWIAGDEAYVCTESLLTPYPASQAEGYIFRQSFNFYLSSMRMHVEQAFGMLKGKWLILDDLKFDTEVCSTIIILAMKLHNYCLDKPYASKAGYRRSESERNRIREQSEEWYQLAKKDDFDRVNALGQCSTFGDSLEASFADAPSIKREHFVALLEVIGKTRPDC